MQGSYDTIARRLQADRHDGAARPARTNLSSADPVFCHCFYWRAVVCDWAWLSACAFLAVVEAAFLQPGQQHDKSGNTEQQKKTRTGRYYILAAYHHSPAEGNC